MTTALGSDRVSDDMTEATSTSLAEICGSVCNSGVLTGGRRSGRFCLLDVPSKLLSLVRGVEWGSWLGSDKVRGRFRRGRRPPNLRESGLSARNRECKRSEGECLDLILTFCVGYPKTLDRV